MPRPYFREERKGLTGGTQLGRDNVMQELESEITYTYLGIEEGEGTEHHKMKASIQKKYKRRIKLVLKSELNAKK